MRSALAEARTRQAREERRGEEQRALDGELASVRQQADVYRGAAASVRQRASRGRGPPGAFGACCAPACHEACDPCEDGARELLHEWRREREGELGQRFAEADAYAAAAEAAAEAQRGRPPRESLDAVRRAAQPRLRAGVRGT